MVANGVVDFVADIFPGVMFEPNDGRALNTNAVLAKFSRELTRVSALEFGVVGLRRFQAHPYPRDAQIDRFLDRVFADRVSRGKHRHSPTLSGPLHALKQLHGALAMQQKVFVITKKVWTFRALSMWLITSKSSSPLS